LKISILPILIPPNLAANVIDYKSIFSTEQSYKCAVFVNETHMKKTLLYFIFLTTFITYAQHPGGGECHFKSTNKDWISQFKKAENRTAKLEMITSKIMEDAVYFEENPPLEHSDDMRVMGTIPCSKKCTIRFGLMYDLNKGMLLDMHKNPEIEDLLLDLTSKNIPKIELNEVHARDIYKKVANKRSGVVLYTKDRDLKKRIRRVKREIEKAR
jgi:hypothetical protein